MQGTNPVMHPYIKFSRSHLASFEASHGCKYVQYIHMAQNYSREKLGRNENKAKSCNLNSYSSCSGPEVM